MPEPDTTVADLQPINMPLPKNIVNVAVTNFWLDMKGVDAVLVKSPVEVFCSRKSDRDFLDGTQQTKIVNDILASGGCVWLLGTESFTKRHRPVDKMQLVTRERAQIRKREDIELMTICDALHTTIERKIPFIAIGTHEEDIVSFAALPCFVTIIKAYTEIDVRRYGSLTLLCHQIKLPTGKCLEAIEGCHTMDMTYVVRWAIAAVRQAMATNMLAAPKRVVFKRGGEWQNQLSKVARNQMHGRRGGIFFEGKVKEVQDDPFEEEKLIGGLRRTARSVSKLPSVMVAGGKLGRALDQYLDDNPQCVTFVTQLLHDGQEVAHDHDGGGQCTPHCRQCVLNKFTNQATEVFAELTGAVDVSAVNDGQGLSTALKPGLFEAWRKFSGDPDTEIEKWLRTGGPCGLVAKPVNTGIFAAAEDVDDINDPMSILMDEPDMSLTRIDADEDAYSQIEKYVQKGYVRKFASTDDAEHYVGGKLVLSSLVIIEKTKPDGSVKRRVILNCLSSGVSKSSQKAEKAVLPRVLDVVFEVLETAAETKKAVQDDDIGAEAWVADIVDAYWNVPIDPRERRFFCCKLRGSVYVFLRATQGSRGGPLLWARTKAMSARCAQSTCSLRNTRVNVYVDDPIIITVGHANMRRKNITKILLVWLILGFAIAWHKAQHGANVIWTSAKFYVSLDKVVVEIKPELLEHIWKDVCEFLESNVVAVKRLRTLVGRAIHVSSIIMFWVPFVAQLWAPLTQKGQSSAPLGCVWTKQIRQPLLWIHAFISHQKGAVKREYTVESYLEKEIDTQIITDASPWGLGAVLVVQGVAKAFFGVALTVEDEVQLDIKIGEAACQQVVEALCILVALRTWADAWKLSRCVFGVRSDSVSALSLLLFCRAKGPTVGRIAREVALDLAEGIYRPKVGSHIPGVLNVSADALSRLFVPDGSYQIPDALAKVHRDHPPPRNAQFYRVCNLPDTAAQLA